MLLQLTLELQPIEPIKEYRWITQEEQKEILDIIFKEERKAGRAILIE